MVFGKSWVYLCLSISANVLLGTYYLFFNFHCSVFLFLIETVVVQFSRSGEDVGKSGKK